MCVCVCVMVRCCPHACIAGRGKVVYTGGREHILSALFTVICTTHTERERDEKGKEGGGLPDILILYMLLNYVYNQI